MHGSNDFADSGRGWSSRCAAVSSAARGRLQHLTMFVSTTLNSIRLGKRARYWLPVLLFAVLIGAQTVARTGDFAGYLDSTKPARNRFSQILVVDGYVLLLGRYPGPRRCPVLPEPGQVLAGSARP